MKCPNCGTELRDYQIFHEQFNDMYIEYFDCTCPDCGEMWEWSEVYEFKYVEGPWRIKKDDDHP